jgi:tripartite-type tricarboxylate transporter receptor subunit TctC
MHARRFVLGALLATVMPTVADRAVAEPPGAKSFTMVVNFAAGGNVDTEGRIFQRHLGRHLPGKPRIVVQNSPGSGGLTAINQLGAGIGVKDPSATIGFVTFNPVAELIGDPALKVKIGAFSIVASVGQWYVAYVRKDALPGKRRPVDIANAKRVRAAGYARSSNHDIRIRLMFELMGVDGKVVTGFRSVGAVNKAIAHGEIDFMLSALPGYHAQALPMLIEPGIAIPMWQLGAHDASGRPVASPELARRGIRLFEDVFRDAHGRMPGGAQYEALRIGNDTAARLARIALMPPGASPDAVAGMRKAFEALRTDQEFAAEYERIIGKRPSLFTAAEAERSLSKAMSGVDPAVKAVFEKAAGMK